MEYKKEAKIKGREIIKRYNKSFAKTIRNMLKTITEEKNRE